MYKGFHKGGMISYQIVANLNYQKLIFHGIFFSMNSQMYLFHQEEIGWLLSSETLDASIKS